MQQYTIESVPTIHMTLYCLKRQINLRYNRSNYSCTSQFFDGCKNHVVSLGMWYCLWFTMLSIILLLSMSILTMHLEIGEVTAGWVHPLLDSLWDKPMPTPHLSFSFYKLPFWPAYYRGISSFWIWQLKSSNNNP